MEIKFSEIDVENILEDQSNLPEIDTESQGVVEQHNDQPPVNPEAQHRNPMVKRRNLKMMVGLR